MELEEAIKRLSMKAITSSADAPDYPNCIVMKKDLITILNQLTKQENMIEILLDLYWNKEQARLIIEYGLESKKQLRKEIEKKAEEIN